MLNYFKIITFYTLIYFFQTVNLQSPDPDESFCYNDLEKKDYGVCISLNTQLNNCPKLKKLLISKKIDDWENLRRTICSENITNGRICCPLEGEGSYQDDALRDSEPDYKSHENWNLFSIKSTNCGRTGSAPRLRGGNDATLGQFPFMARIGYVNMSNDKPIFSCSGTIISKRYILTAAHCLLAYKQGYQLAPVRLADNDDSINPESYYNISVHYRDFDVEEVHFHPNYTWAKTSAHDIALIRLKEDIENITSDPFAAAICLPFVNEYNLGRQLDEAGMVKQREDVSKNYWGIVMGWGKADHRDENGSSILQFLAVPLQPSIICRIQYANSSYSNKHICAGGEQNKNTCLGDSGGPLVYNAAHSVMMRSTKERNVTRRYQIGIVSYGRTECAQKGVPVVYTRVRDYLWWILQTVRK